MDVAPPNEDISQYKTVPQHACANYKQSKQTEKQDTTLQGVYKVLFVYRPCKILSLIYSIQISHFVHNKKGMQRNNCQLYKKIKKIKQQKHN